ncbi:MAG: hypothetical protein WC916_03765 [Candidatus Woesearchaeota archaeon]
MTKNLDITKEKYFRPIIERILESSPNGVYASEIMLGLNLKYKEVNKVVYYLESSGAVRILHPHINYPEVSGAHPTYMMIVPIYEKLLAVYTKFFTFRGWIRRARDYEVIISVVTVLIAIASLILAIIAISK